MFELLLGDCTQVDPGWEEVVGIELDPEYCEIAQTRLAYYTRQPMFFLQDG